MILVVEDSPTVLKLVTQTLTLAGYHVFGVEDGVEALEFLSHTVPDLIVSDIQMPRMNGLDLLRQVREDPRTANTTVIMLTAMHEQDDIVRGFDLGADDYLVKPFKMPELRARVSARLKRPQVVEEDEIEDRRDAVLSVDAFAAVVGQEITRAAAQRLKSCLAAIAFYETTMLTGRVGRLDQQIGEQLIALLRKDGDAREVVGQDAEGGFLLLMPEQAALQARARLRTLARQIAEHDFVVRDEHIRLTPVLGFTQFTGEGDAVAVIQEATLAREFSTSQLDLEPQKFSAAMRPNASPLHRVTAEFKRVTRWHVLSKNRNIILQMSTMLLVMLVLPFIVYLLAGPYGAALSNMVYLVVVVALLATALLIWYESAQALKKEELPPVGAPFPKASAIIPAYLPNEAGTIIATIEAFQRMDYPGELQIILAYNTPHDMPIETELQAMDRRDSRFMALRVQNSTSKAQNVNAALSLVQGAFVGVFDADHQPDPDSYTRAWHWLSNGYDVVQGHCLIRNGDSTSVARTVAVEFEGIYAVAHPGRTRLHQFGIFGGSNGYWKTELLHTTRMHGFMLTEDIDSSIRTVAAGYRIKTDPLIISRELAPTSLSAVWNQRMRWAQGWFQVSMKYALPAMFRSELTPRQKLGIFHLLIWREVYPWISTQIFPIVIYWA